MGKAQSDSSMLVAVFEFTGTFQKTDDLLFAVCDHAPLVAQGDTIEDALEHMKRLIELYLGTLRSSDALNAALVAGDVRVRFTDRSPRGPSRPHLTIIKRDDHSFEAQAELPQLAA